MMQLGALSATRLIPLWRQTDQKAPETWCDVGVYRRNLDVFVSLNLTRNYVVTMKRRRSSTRRRWIVGYLLMYVSTEYGATRSSELELVTREVGTREKTVWGLPHCLRRSARGLASEAELRDPSVPSPST